jgi:sugar phosphate isomerase/epimerase
LNIMKLSVVLSTQPAKFSAVTYKGEITENLAKIAQMGYDGVELAVRDPILLDLPELEKSLAKHNLLVSAIGTGQVYGEDGLSFTHPDVDIREKTVVRLLSHLELAEKLNSLVIIGLIRGQNVAEVGEKYAEDWLLEGLHQCATEYKNVQLAIEPINRYETDLLNTVGQTLKFLDRLQVENVGLLLDTFHMNIEEPSLSESIRMTGKKLFHFHVADSNRWYPGAGHIDFSEILQSLNAVYYRGFISGEMLPLPDPDTAALKMIEFFKYVIPLSS